MELNEITKAHAAVLLRLCVEQADQFDCWPRKQAGSPDFDPELFERQIRTIADEGVSARVEWMGAIARYSRLTDSPGDTRSRLSDREIGRDLAALAAVFVECVAGQKPGHAVFYAASQFLQRADPKRLYEEAEELCHSAMDRFDWQSAAIREGQFARRESAELQAAPDPAIYQETRARVSFSRRSKSGRPTPSLGEWTEWHRRGFEE